VGLHVGELGSEVGEHLELVGAELGTVVLQLVLKRVKGFVNVCLEGICCNMNILGIMY